VEQIRWALISTDPSPSRACAKPFVMLGAMTHPFWFSAERWVVRALLLAVIALNLGIV